MWKAIFENSALFLGLVISIYTIYIAINNYLIRRRQKIAIIRSLDIKLKYLITLAESLAKRAENTKDKYPVYIRDGSQRGGLPPDSQDDVEELLLRTYHVLEYEVRWDEEKLGSVLNEEQLDAFLEFLKPYQIYREVLTVRANQLKRSPDNVAELCRLASVSNLNLNPLKEHYEKFRELII